MTKSAVPRVTFANSVWKLPALKAGAGAGLPADFSSHHWKAPSLQQREDGRVHRLAGQTMGTHWSLRLVNPEFAALDAAQSKVQSVLDEVIAQMSNWEPDSLISRFNAADAGTAFELPSEFSKVLDAAIHWAKKSGGAIDPSMGALVSLWGFGPRAEPLAPHSGSCPDATAIRALLDRSGFDKLQWQAGQTSLRQSGGVQLDLCGIAKGFAVDAVVQRLQQEGWQAGLFEIGGELRSWGIKPDGRDWQIQLGSGAQSESQDSAQVVSVKSGSFATSGDYWHHFFADGRRFSHTIDPRTGWPIAHGLASVTVHHEECMHADALATVLTVLGAREGMEFAERNDIAAVFREHGAAEQQNTVDDLARPSPLLITPAWKVRFAS